jgi:hypothetical protein
MYVVESLIVEDRDDKNFPCKLLFNVNRSYNLIDRLRQVWRVLRGKDLFYEFFLDQKDTQSIKRWANADRPEPNG